MFSADKMMETSSRGLTKTHIVVWSRKCNFPAKEEERKVDKEGIAINRSIEHTGMTHVAEDLYTLIGALFTRTILLGLKFDWLSILF
jgi:hypothetical protein